MDELLEVRGLHIEFHDHLVPETVVHDLSLSLSQGEILGIVGESGSGKSMTALAVAGLLNRHDMKKQGQILFEGRDLLSCPRSQLRQIQGRDIGVVFQEPMTSLNPVKRIGWQVEESLRIHTELTKQERYRRVVEALQDAELMEAERICRMYPHQLSGGMRQRVMIAAAFVCEPTLLIEDEPTTALDVTVQAQILRLLKRKNREKKTAILFISHDLSLVRGLCERVIVMHRGRAVEAGRTEEVFEHPREAYTKALISAIPRCGKGQKGGRK